MRLQQVLLTPRRDPSLASAQLSHKIGCKWSKCTMMWPNRNTDAEGLPMMVVGCGVLVPADGLLPLILGSVLWTDGKNTILIVAPGCTSFRSLPTWGMVSGTPTWPSADPWLFGEAVMWKTEGTAVLPSKSIANESWNRWWRKQWRGLEGYLW